MSSPSPWFASDDGQFVLYHGDSLEVLPALSEHGKIRMIFADPPYFLSNDGVTCQSGKMVSVNKGEWDRLTTVDDMHEFNRAWLQACKSSLHPDGTIWISGTRHVIYSIGFAMQQLGFKVLNDIVWEKPNPPPNLSCRYFTHSTEIILWSAAGAKSKYTFNYESMKQMNGDKQMKSVWTMTAPGGQEKTCGRHPTQKPLALLERIVLASTNPGDVILDPFNGSGTTGIAANRHGRRYIGIERELEFLELTKRRFLQLSETPALFTSLRRSTSSLFGTQEQRSQGIVEHAIRSESDVDQPVHIDEGLSEGVVHRVPSSPIRDPDKADVIF